MIPKFGDLRGKLPGLVVSVKDSMSETWSLDVSSIPGYTKKLDGPHNGRKMKIIKTAKRGKSHQKLLKKKFGNLKMTMW